MILGIIIGIFLWQTVTMLVCVITGEKEDIFIPVSFGAWSIFFCIIGHIYRSIRLACLRRYNYYEIYGKPKEGLSNPHNWYIDSVFMTPKTAKKFRNVNKYGCDYAIKLVREGKNFKSCPDRSKTVKDGDTFPAMSREMFEKFLERAE